MSISAASEMELTGSPRERGILHRIAIRIVEARQAEANRAVAEYLVNFDDETLDKLGYKRDDLRASAPRGYLFL